MMEDNATRTAFPPPDPGVIPSNLPFFVVGLGASAGGLDALRRFFSVTPADNGMAFVIVLHLSPDHESNAAEILQAKTRMRVAQVNETTTIEPNHVYVIPPTKNLIMHDGTLQVVDAARPPGGHTTINTFFRTLAEAHRERAVGVVLSGAGSDGAVGIARIKERGGITLAQSPADAEYDSMPCAAISTGAVDIVLPVVEMPEKLIQLARNAAAITLPPLDNLESGIADPEGRDKALRDVLALLQLRTGHDFNPYKKATVLRRLERRLQVTAVPDVVAYRAYLEHHPEETRLLLQDMLISVTNFFRDRDAFDALERDVVPRIFRESLPTEDVRAWSIGCATGEEPYSLAMLFAEQAALEVPPRNFQVFGSDIDERAIAVARRALYPESIVTDVSPARIRQHFERQDNHYCVRKDVRDHVLFAIHNALRDPPFSRMNLISCRNLLIYLDRDVQRKVFEMMHYALGADGYLFLGNAESAEAVPDLFVALDKKNRLYRPLKRRAGSHYLPSQPALRAPVPPAPITTTSIEEKKDRAVQQLHHQLLQEMAPPSILVDEHNDMLYSTQSAGKFLQPPAGEFSRSVLRLVHPDLQLELRAALFHAAKTGQPVRTRPVARKQDGAISAVSMSLRPAPRQHPAAGMTLLMFHESYDAADIKEASGNGDNDIARHLDEELKNTKEQLRALIDQYEAAMADLKASNEELQAVNEELRSAMEELETSKEELQSVNEELVTVNTELKSKVDETTKANDDLQNFFSATEIATIFVDRNLRIKRYSKPAQNLFNMISSDVGRPLADITHRLKYPELISDIERVLEEFRPQEREVPAESGQWFMVRLLPYRTEGNLIDGVVVTCVNVSSRKAVEEQLDVSERRMHLIAASTRDYAIATMDMKGVITGWNSGAERLFGYSESEILGKSSSILFLPEDRAAGQLERELRQALVEGRFEDDRWHQRRDGSQVFCSGITSPLVDDHVQGFVKIARDLTGVKRDQDHQEARLEWERQERVRAEESARLRDEFFAVLSHELKQPLNLIQLTVEMMVRTPESGRLPVVVKGAERIKRCVEGQVKIIDDLMDLSRLRTGKLTLNRAQVNLKEAVATVVNLMTPDAQRKQVELRIEESAEDATVFGDEVRIEQIVWNLVSNAVKFTPAKGQVSVRITQDKDFACIEVADNGRGIPAEFLPFVFDMFKQADSGTTREFGGMGIGLALVQELVNSHGGHVEAHSQGLGHGAKFLVFLPRFMPSRSTAGAAQVGAVALAGKRILLVDDARDTLDSLAQLLRMQDAEVTEAASGAQALDAARSSSKAYDLIISDIAMPGMDGYCLLAELRKLAVTGETPAIALSGFTRDADVDRALAAGFATHARKPVSLDQLLDAAARAIA